MRVLRGARRYVLQADRYQFYVSIPDGSQTLYIHAVSDLNQRLTIRLVDDDLYHRYSVMLREFALTCRCRTVVRSSTPPPGADLLTEHPEQAQALLMDAQFS